MNIVIVDYNTGNIQSLKNAFERMGVNAVISSIPKQIESATHVILPGVGHARTALDALNENGLGECIQSLSQPVLGICLGMQILFDATEETEMKGLGIFSSKVDAMDFELKIPHMGWNQIKTLRGPLFEAIEEKAYVYFVHSFFARNEKYVDAYCDYGNRFAAAVSKDNFYGCQFHPEKSGEVGQQILKNFISLR